MARAASSETVVFNLPQPITASKEDDTEQRDAKPRSPPPPPTTTLTRDSAGVRP